MSHYNLKNWVLQIEESTRDVTFTAISRKMGDIYTKTYTIAELDGIVPHLNGNVTDFIETLDKHIKSTPSISIVVVRMDNYAMLSLDSKVELTVGKTKMEVDRERITIRMDKVTDLELKDVLRAQSALVNDPEREEKEITRYRQVREDIRQVDTMTGVINRQIIILLISMIILHFMAMIVMILK